MMLQLFTAIIVSSIILPLFCLKAHFLEIQGIYN